jgi:hypothetical protein
MLWKLRAEKRLYELKVEVDGAPIEHSWGKTGVYRSRTVVAVAIEEFMNTPEHIVVLHWSNCFVAEPHLHLPSR